ncbi:MAG: glycosyltransferase family 2 protein [Lachnospiraceae bacterium]|nr:glycosyltransferase family 2 protein [Lachnospiraceae bacterium]
MNPIISVIVPVFNSENTLAECLGNLLNQTYENIEVILVDDASTDNSCVVMEAAKEQFPEKVIILKQEKNKGPGAARNLGLSHAGGEYIGFVDSDDRVDPAMYEKLYTLITENEADIADCAFYKESDDSASLHFSKELCGELNDSKRSDLIAAGGYAVTKLYRKDFLLDNGIVYREDYILEDMDLMMLMIAKAAKVAGTEEVLYIYRDRASSQSKEMDPAKYIMACCNAMVAIYERLSPLKGYTRIREAAEYGMASLYSNAVNLCLMKYKSAPEVYLSMLETLRQLARKCIFLPLGRNKYIRRKMDKQDLKVIEANSKDPRTLLAKVGF